MQENIHICSDFWQPIQTDPAQIKINYSGRTYTTNDNNDLYIAAVPRDTLVSALPGPLSVITKTGKRVDITGELIEQLTLLLDVIEQLDDDNPLKVLFKLNKMIKTIQGTDNED